MAKKESDNKFSYSDILQQISLKQFAPIYVLMGEETYFIDKIVDKIENTILTEDEKDLNFVVRYATPNASGEEKEKTVLSTINDANQYPILSSYRIVILKESQNLEKGRGSKSDDDENNEEDHVGSKKPLDNLAYYLNEPMESTILVIVCKQSKLDGKKKWLKMAKEKGVVFTSDRLYENQLQPYITAFAKAKGLTIEREATEMLIQHVGADLTRIESIFNKLSQLLTDRQTVSTKDIENTTGITKAYSSFELLDTLIEGDITKANLIINHTTEVVQQIIPILFNYFSNLLIYEYLTDKSRENAIATLQIAPFTYPKYVQGEKRFGKMKVFLIIGYLRHYDAMSKGIGVGSTVKDNEILKELIYKILH